MESLFTEGRNSSTKVSYLVAMGFSVDRHHQITIIGGGVAGLCAANHLADLGVKPLVIEGGTYPTQRICGEFLSYECLPILEEWGVTDIRPVSRCQFVKNGDTYDFPFPRPCGSYPRVLLEQKLLERALDRGVEVRTATRVLSWDNNIVELSTGEKIQADELIISAGRFSSEVLPPKYYAYKVHLSGIDMDDVLQMHCIDGGYGGIVAIEKGVVNTAILAEKPYDPASFVFGQLQFDWLQGRVPEFGIRNTPLIPHVYWVGDAMGSIPPASGQGLSLAITSGRMVADYATKGAFQGYRKAWLKRYRSRFFWAKLLHRYLLHPYAFTSIKTLGALLPPLPRILFKLTRE